ncbi:hypothetical protein PG995_004499 [Apiospora arundinis]
MSGLERLPMELLDMIRDRLDLRDTTRLAATCRSFYQMGWGHSKWNVDRYLERSGWVTSGARLRQVLGQAEAYIVGQTVFDFLRGREGRKHYMTVMVLSDDGEEGRDVEVLQRHLENEEGYTAEERRLGVPRDQWMAKDRSRILLRGLLSRDVRSYWTEEARYSTLVSFLSHNKLVSLCPYLTFVEKVFFQTGAGFPLPWVEERLVADGWQDGQVWLSKTTKRQKARCCGQVRFLAAVDEEGQLDPVGRPNNAEYGMEEITGLSKLPFGLHTRFVTGRGGDA